MKKLIFAIVFCFSFAVSGQAQIVPDPNLGPATDSVASGDLHQPADFSQPSEPPSSPTTTHCPASYTTQVIREYNTYIRRGLSRAKALEIVNAELSRHFAAFREEADAKYATNKRLQDYENMATATFARKDDVASTYESKADAAATFATQKSVDTLSQRVDALETRAKGSTAPPPTPPANGPAVVTPPAQSQPQDNQKTPATNGAIWVGIVLWIIIAGVVIGVILLALLALKVFSRRNRTP